MQFSMLQSGEQILSYKLCLVFYAGDSLTVLKIVIWGGKELVNGQKFYCTAMC